MKHNKKRNTAFLYETLVQQLTKSIVSKDQEQKKIIIDILKEHFSSGTVLHKEMSLYKTLNNSKGMDKKIAEKIIFESKVEHDFLPKDQIFREQSKVIDKINKNLGTSVFSNFVKDYKDLATIAQVLNASLPVKERVLLEEEVLQRMCSSEEAKKEMLPLDKLTYNTFVNKFNTKYADSLLSEQKDLLTNYLISFSDNGLSLKIFLNEELERVRGELQKCIKMNEIKEDKEMLRKTNVIIEKLELFKKKECDQQMLSELLKIQNFVKEARTDV